METVDNREVLASREEHISLAHSFNMDATPGTRIFTKAPALIRAKGAYIPSQKLIDIIDGLPDGSEIVIKTKVNEFGGTKAVSYGMSIRLPKEAYQELKEETDGES